MPNPPHSYTQRLRQHYETYYGIPGEHLVLEAGPTEKLHPDFYTLEFAPNPPRLFGRTARI